MPEQRDITDKGGTMRLGAVPLQDLTGGDSRQLPSLRAEPVISERHRHRYEFNNLVSRRAFTAVRPEVCRA